MGYFGLIEPFSILLLGAYGPGGRRCCCFVCLDWAGCPWAYWLILLDHSRWDHLLGKSWLSVKIAFFSSSEYCCTVLESLLSLNQWQLFAHFLLWPFFMSCSQHGPCWPGFRASQSVSSSPVLPSSVLSSALSSSAGQRGFLHFNICILFQSTSRPMETLISHFTGLGKTSDLPLR